jgi:hypothetical protein
MNIFKYSRGHFFGTLLPGAFLLLNIVLIDPSFFQLLPLQDKLNSKDNQTIILIAGFIISYVIGVALRLLSPDILERIAYVIKIPKFLLYPVYDKLIGKDKPKTIKDRFNIGKQLYPYADWFFDDYITDSTNQHKDYYNKILTTELNGNRKLLGRNFINHCKTFIYDSSEGLSEEIMYNEGLIRFICGIIYSLLFVLIISAFHFSELTVLFFSYLSIFIVFLYRLRGVRAKEAVGILDGYMFLKLKKTE